MLKLKKIILVYVIKVLVQPGLGNNGRNFGRNLNHQTSYLYKCEVAELRSKAGNFLSGKRGGAGRGGEAERKRNRQRQRKRKLNIKREKERKPIIKIKSNAVLAN
jgi:hypothetical protein